MAAGISHSALGLDISCISAGDGFFHNESGSSYDYFDSTSHSVIVNRYFDGLSSSIQDRTGYLQFSLAALSPTDVIASATLKLYLTASHYADDSPSAGFINHVANSSGANGNASQRLNGSELVVEIKDQPLGWLELEVTDYLRNDHAAGYGYSCFSLNMNTEGYFDNAGFTVTSSDAGTNVPTLAISLVPEPSASALVAILVAGFAGIVRRKPSRRTQDSR